MLIISMLNIYIYIPNAHFQVILWSTKWVTEQGKWCDHYMSHQQLWFPLEIINKCKERFSNMLYSIYVIKITNNNEIVNASVNMEYKCWVEWLHRSYPHQGYVSLPCISASIMMDGNALWQKLPRRQGSWGQHGAHLGPIGPGGLHVGPMNLAIWADIQMPASHVIDHV